MKALVINGIVYGAFKSIEELDDRYLCGNVEMQFSVVGKGEIVDADTVEIPVATPQKTKQDIENSLSAFAKDLDFDGIGEASALLNSTNVTWQNEAARFIELWDLTWQAFYNNEPLPALVWE